MGTDSRKQGTTTWLLARPGKSCHRHDRIRSMELDAVLLSILVHCVSLQCFNALHRVVLEVHAAYLDFGCCSHIPVPAVIRILSRAGAITWLIFANQQGVSKNQEPWHRSRIVGPCYTSSHKRDPPIYSNIHVSTRFRAKSRTRTQALRGLSPSLYGTSFPLRRTKAAVEESKYWVPAICGAVEELCYHNMDIWEILWFWDFTWFKFLSSNPAIVGSRPW